MSPPPQGVPPHLAFYTILGIELKFHSEPFTRLQLGAVQRIQWRGSVHASTKCEEVRGQHAAVILSAHHVYLRY